MNNNNPQGPRVQRPKQDDQGNQPKKNRLPDYGDRPEQIPTLEDNVGGTEVPTSNETAAGE